MSYLETSVSELSARPLSDDELRLIEDSWGQSHRRSRKTVANSNGELVWPDIAKLACLDAEKKYPLGTKTRNCRIAEYITAETTIARSSKQVASYLQTKKTKRTRKRKIGGRGRGVRELPGTASSLPILETASTTVPCDPYAPHAEFAAVWPDGPRPNLGPEQKATHRRSILDVEDFDFKKEPMSSTESLPLLDNLCLTSSDTEETLSSAASQYSPPSSSFSLSPEAPDSPTFPLAKDERYGLNNMRRIPVSSWATMYAPRDHAVPWPSSVTQPPWSPSPYHNPSLPNIYYHAHVGTQPVVLYDHHFLSTSTINAFDMINYSN